MYLRGRIPPPGLHAEYASGLNLHMYLAMLSVRGASPIILDGIRTTVQ
jgi:hypothetical protein